MNARGAGAGFSRRRSGDDECASGTTFPSARCKTMTNASTIPNKPVIMIVEDDYFSRHVAVESFRDAGFIVFDTENADRALAILAFSGAQIHALFTDINMPPGMNGVSLACQTRQRWPWIKLAVTSGEAKPPAAALPVDARFFPKPYDIDRIVSHFLGDVLVAA